MKIFRLSFWIYHSDIWRTIRRIPCAIFCFVTVLMSYWSAYRCVGKEFSSWWTFRRRSCAIQIFLANPLCFPANRISAEIMTSITTRSTVALARLWMNEFHSKLFRVQQWIQVEIEREREKMWKMTFGDWVIQKKMRKQNEKGILVLKKKEFEWKKVVE